MAEVVNRGDNNTERKPGLHAVDLAWLAKMSLERLLYYVLVELREPHAKGA